jgi:hypothetical protein
MDELEQRFHDALVALIERDPRLDSPFLRQCLKPWSRLRLQGVEAAEAQYDPILQIRRVRLRVAIDVELTRKDWIDSLYFSRQDEGAVADFEGSVVQEPVELPAPARALESGG